MTNNIIARTGRVQSWMDDPNSRLPVSCTVFVVEDSMEGENGIEASWRFVSHALRYGAGVAIHLSKLRAAGTDNGRGLVASGPVSFGKSIAALMNSSGEAEYTKTERWSFTLTSPILTSLSSSRRPRHELPWAKRCVNLTKDLWNEAAVETKDAILKGIARGDIWLAKKIRHDQARERIHANVCLEVFLRSRGTCLLEHINLGACRPEDLSSAFTAGMKELCDLHGKTGVEKTGEYLTQESDRQVGLGMLGLANLLSLEGVTYSQFADALDYQDSASQDLVVTPEALKIVKHLQQGIDAAAEVAMAAGMMRAFAIAPTASCSYRYTDRAGYTTAPELAPPIGRTVDRDSSTFGVEQFDYGNVETCEVVGWFNYKRVVDGIMRMINRTGLAPRL